MYSEIDDFLRKSTLAESTKTLYGRCLLEFFTWLRINRLRQVGSNIEKATDNEFFDFIEQQTGWSNSMCYSAACAMRAFYRWKFGGTHSMLRIRVRRVDPGPQRTLTWNSLDKLLASLDTSTDKGVRDLAMITMMVDTGLRASELCRLDLKFLDLENNTVQVRIKGGAWATSAFFVYAHTCLINWLSIRTAYAQEGVSAIFVSIGGLHPGTPITRDGLRSIFRQLGANADLGLISPHDMRRTMATLSIRAGAPTRVVQVAGHWKSMRMVQRYSEALVADDMRPYSPINKLMGVSE